MVALPRSLLLFSRVTAPLLLASAACQLVFSDFTIDRTALDRRLCEEGEYRCVGPVLSRCSLTGDGWVFEQECGAKSRCDSDLKQCTACGTEEYRCDGAALQICNAERSAWETFETCAAPELCNLLLRDCAACTPGEFQCSEGTLMKCENDGRFRASEPCQAPDLCMVSLEGKTGACLSNPMCTEGTYRCDGATLQRCGQRGWIFVEGCADAAKCLAVASLPVQAGEKIRSCDPPACGVAIDGQVGGGSGEPGDSCTVPCSRAGEWDCDAVLNLRRCSSDLRWQEVAVCDTQDLCSKRDQRCHASICATNSRRCLGQTPQRCRGDRMGWETLGVCSQGEVCDLKDERGCVASPCQEGARRCNDQVLEICRGGAWVPLQLCATASHCGDQGAATLGCAESCTPGQTRCEARGFQQQCEGNLKWGNSDEVPVTVCP